jgi:hypothetical protein
MHPLLLLLGLFILALTTLFSNSPYHQKYHRESNQNFDSAENQFVASKKITGIHGDVVAE